MTRIIGLPVSPVGGTPPTKLVIQESNAYQGGPGRLSTGRYEASWNYTSSKWEVAPGVELTVIMPRLGMNDPMARGTITTHITTDFTDSDKSHTSSKTYFPQEWIENSTGVLDITINPTPQAIIPTPTLASQLANLNTGLASLNSGLASIPPALADIAQTRTLLEQAGNVGRVAAEADLTGKPAGVYEIIGTNERVTWSGTAITARGPMLLSASGLYTRAAEANTMRAASLSTPAPAPYLNQVRYWQAELSNPLTDTAYTDAPVGIHVSFERGQCLGEDYLRLRRDDGVYLPFQYEAARDPRTGLLLGEYYPDGSLRDGTLWVILDNLPAGGSRLFTLEIWETPRNNAFPPRIVFSQPNTFRDTFTATYQRSGEGAARVYAYTFSSTRNWALNAVERTDSAAPMVFDVSASTSSFLNALYYDNTGAEYTSNNGALTTLISRTTGVSGVVYVDYETVWTLTYESNIRVTTKTRIFANGESRVSMVFDVLATVAGPKIRGLSMDVRPKILTTPVESSQRAYGAQEQASNQLLIGFDESQFWSEAVPAKTPYFTARVYMRSTLGKIQFGWQNSNVTLPAGLRLEYRAYIQPDYGNGTHSTQVLRANNRLWTRATGLSVSEAKSEALALQSAMLRAFTAYNAANPPMPGLHALALIGVQRVTGFNQGLDPRSWLQTMLDTRYGGGTKAGFFTAWSNNSYGLQHQGREVVALWHYRNDRIQRGDGAGAAWAEGYIHTWADAVVDMETDSRTRWMALGVGDDPGRIELSPSQANPLNAATSALVILAMSLNLTANSTRLACFQRIATRWATRGIEHRNKLPRSASEDNTAALVTVARDEATRTYPLNTYNSIIALSSTYCLYSILDAHNANKLYPLGVALPSVRQMAYQVFNAAGQAREYQTEFDTDRRGLASKQLMAAALLIEHGGRLSDYAQAIVLLRHVWSRRYPNNGREHPLDGWFMKDGLPVNMAIDTQLLTEPMLSITEQ